MKKAGVKIYIYSSHRGASSGAHSLVYIVYLLLPFSFFFLVSSPPLQYYNAVPTLTIPIACVYFGVFVCVLLD